MIVFAGNADIIVCDLPSAQHLTALAEPNDDGNSVVFIVSYQFILF